MKLMTRSTSSRLLPESSFIIVNSVTGPPPPILLRSEITGRGVVTVSTTGWSGLVTS